MCVTTRQNLLFLELEMTGIESRTAPFAPLTPSPLPPSPPSPQVVDDILDFTQTSEQLGKPAGSDLASGNLTAPALFTLQGPMGARLRALIETEFVEDGSLEEAVDIVKSGGGLEAARKLAKVEGDLARGSLKSLPEGEAKRSLEGMVDYVLDRIF